MKEAERILINGAWLGVGSNTPWGIDGKIESITVYEDDPRDMAGADSAYVKIKFDSGYYLEVKTKEYMILRKENENN